MPITSKYQNYYPFGLMMSGRSWSDGYRFGFNGKELDADGMGGHGSTYDYGFRIYNPAIAKFLSVDPLTASYPWYTPYQFAGNKPIIAIDLDGLEEQIRIRIGYDLLNGETKIKHEQYDDKFSITGPLGEGILYVDAQIVQKTDRNFIIAETVYYGEPNSTGTLENYQLLYYRETIVNSSEEAKVMREGIKHYRGYFGMADEEFYSMFEEFALKYIDQEALLELAKVFAGPQSNWGPEHISEGKKFKGYFNVDKSFIPGDDTTYILDDKGDTTHFRVEGKRSSRSKGAHIERTYKPKNDGTE